MGSTFNSQILVDKLGRLNNSQQSIETLSHWCIFHRRNAKQVVETWAHRFHCSALDQRVSFLYLANDILQNSRRKGLEFVTEFWKVLPDALHDVLENGDDFGRNAALRLINIWEERKVFVSRGHSLKEELLGKKFENGARNENNAPSNNKPPKRPGLEGILSCYEAVYGGPVDEDAVLDKCRTAISCAEKMKDLDDNLNQTDCVEKLRRYCDALRESIEQLKIAESSRAALVLHLRDTLREQESKLGEVRDQLQAAQLQFDQAGLLISNKGLSLSDERKNGSNITFSDKPANFASESTQDGSGELKQSALPVIYNHELTESKVPGEEEKRRTEAAAVAAKLAASTSSAQMLSYVLSSLASEGIIRNQTGEAASVDCNPLEKKPKLEDRPLSTHIPSTMVPHLPPPPPTLHPNALQQGGSAISSRLQNVSPPVSLVQQPLLPPMVPSMQPPPLPPTMPPLQPPPPPTGQFDQTAGSMSSIPHTYGSATSALPEYPMANIHFPGAPQYPHPPGPFQNV